jgi:GT2 family glycosyltransferase
MEPRPPLIVIVVNWNGRRDLADCLRSLRESRYEPLRVIVVDNASSDDSVAYTHQHFPEVEIIVAPENRRWAGGNNLALRRLAAEGGPGAAHVLLLNNDTIVPEGSLDRLVAAVAAEPRAWAATPRICYAHDPARVWYDGGVVGRCTGWIRHRGIRRLAGRLPLANRFVGYGTGCALLLTGRALREVGELDESYRLYGEDADYSLRLRAAGGAILHVPRALVLHKVSASLGAASPEKLYLRSRSHVRLLSTHWPARYRPLLVVAQLAFFGGNAAWHLWHGRHDSARQLVLGALDQLRGAPFRDPL